MKSTFNALLGRAHRFDASPGADGKIRTSIWDRFCTLGQKVKEGEESVFDETTLGQMVGNWYVRGGRLAMCQDHKSAATPYVSAPALAFYDAMAIVVDGKVVLFRKLADSGAAEPEVAALRESVQRFATEENPEPSPDGLWGWRCEITPLGEDAKEGLRNYRGISPMFVTDGTDEQENPIGYVLFDVAATNTAFQSSCEITFSRGSAMAVRVRDKRGNLDAASANVGDRVQTTNGPVLDGVILEIARDKFGAGLDGVKVRTTSGTDWYSPLDLCAMSRSGAQAMGGLPPLTPEQQSAYEAWLGERRDSDQNLAHWIAEVQTDWPELAHGVKRAPTYSAASRGPRTAAIQAGAHGRPARPTRMAGDVETVHAPKYKPGDSVWVPGEDNPLTIVELLGEADTGEMQGGKWVKDWLYRVRDAKGREHRMWLSRRRRGTAMAYQGDKQKCPSCGSLDTEIDARDPGGWDEDGHCNACGGEFHVSYQSSNDQGTVTKMARRSTMAAGDIPCPLCDGTGSEKGGVGGRAIRCRACNGERTVTAERAEQIRKDFNLGPAPTVHTRKFGTTLARPRARRFAVDNLRTCPECGKQVAVEGGRYAVHDTGEAGSGTCPESGRPVVYRPIGYATPMATAITPGSLHQGDELTFPQRGVTAHVLWIDGDTVAIQWASGIKSETTVAKLVAQGAQTMSARTRRPFGSRSRVRSPIAAARGNGATMKKILQKLGLAEGAPLAEKMARFSAHAFAATPEETAEMATDLERSGDPQAAEMATKLRRFADDGDARGEEGVSALARKLGVEGGSPDQIHEALGRFAQSCKTKFAEAMDDPAQLARVMSEVDGVLEHEGAEHMDAYAAHFEGLKRLAQSMKRFAGEPAETTTMADDPEGDAIIHAFAKKRGIDPRRTPRAVILGAMAASGVDQAAVDSRVQAALAAEKLRTERATNERRAEELFAIATKCGFSKEAKSGFLAMARANIAEAETFVNSLPGAKALTRLTAGGAPIGATNGVTPQAGLRPGGEDARVNVELADRARQLVERAKTDPQTMSRLTRIAGTSGHPGMLLAAAQKIVADEAPEIVEWAQPSSAPLVGLA